MAFICIHTHVINTKHKINPKNGSITAKVSDKHKNVSSLIKVKQLEIMLFKGYNMPYV